MLVSTDYDSSTSRDHSVQGQGWDRGSDNRDQYKKKNHKITILMSYYYQGRGRGHGVRYPKHEKTRFGDKSNLECFNATSTVTIKMNVELNY